MLFFWSFIWSSLSLLSHPAFVLRRRKSILTCVDFWGWTFPVCLSSLRNKRADVRHLHHVWKDPCSCWVLINSVWKHVRAARLHPSIRSGLYWRASMNRPWTGVSQRLMAEMGRVRCLYTVYVCLCVCERSASTKQRVCNCWPALKALDICLQTDESRITGPGENRAGRDHRRVAVHSAHTWPCGPPPPCFIFISSPARPERPVGPRGGDSSVNHGGLVEHPAFYTL